jgi:phosphoenolpyruvate synthase/pyruvate phosphate dikinase
MTDITPIEEDLGENKELFEQLESAIKDALVVEKEFGAPQDIEGGIKDGKIYFWQSRNIVR